jgi:hypothetical protein
MDQGPLVTEQIVAGAEVAAAFSSSHPLVSAYWMKRADDGDWKLYLVPTGTDDRSIHKLYSILYDVYGRKPHPILEQLQVRLAAPETPVAQDVYRLQSQFGETAPVRLRTQMVGDVFAEDGYVYPLPAAATTTG